VLSKGSEALENNLAGMKVQGCVERNWSCWERQLPVMDNLKQRMNTRRLLLKFVERTLKIFIKHHW
jgi:hypothetical protein